MSLLDTFFIFIICTGSFVLVTAFLKTKKVQCYTKEHTHIHTHIFLHLTQLKHSAMSGNTCAFRMQGNQECRERAVLEKGEWE